MDRFHRKPHGEDTRNGRECRFCSEMDPDFFQRKPMDRLVQSQHADTASAHLTEEGYIKHRIVELAKKRSTLLNRQALSRPA